MTLSFPRLSYVISKHCFPPETGGGGGCEGGVTQGGGRARGGRPGPDAPSPHSFRQGALLTAFERIWHIQDSRSQIKLTRTELDRGVTAFERIWHIFDSHSQINLTRTELDTEFPQGGGCAWGGRPGPDAPSPHPVRQGLPHFPCPDSEGADKSFDFRLQFLMESVPDGN